MYVQSPKGKLIQGLARLGSLAVRGLSAAAAQRRQQHAQAMAVAQMATGESYEAAEEPCAPCEEEQRRLEEEAASFMRGR
jgi:hypothetical protein